MGYSPRGRKELGTTGRLSVGEAMPGDWLHDLAS